MKVIYTFLRLGFTLGAFLMSQISWGQSAQFKNFQDIKSNVREHIYTLASDAMKGRLVGTEENLAAGEYIAHCFADIGLEEYNGSSYYHYFSQPLMGPAGRVLDSVDACNVIGLLSGKDPVLKHEYIVLGAHFDHLGCKDSVVYNGADDNASGVAALLEVARYLKKHEDQLARTVVFAAFDGEEQGLWGSTRFVEDTLVPLAAIKVMFSMDMVGYYAKSEALQLVGLKTLDEETNKLIDKGIATAPNVLRIKKSGFEQSVFGATDTQPFAKKQVPTIYVTTGLKSPYHKPEDDPELIDLGGLADISQTMGTVVLSLASAAHVEGSGRFATSHHLPNHAFFYGASVGVGTNSLHFSQGALDGKPGFASFIGADFSYLYRGQFEVFASALVEQARARFATQAGNVATSKWDFFSVGVPVGVRVHLPSFSNSPVGGYVGLLGYYRVHFAGRDNGNAMDFAQKFNRHEGGMGFEIGLRAGDYRLTFRELYGLSNLLKPGYVSHYQIKNRTSLVVLSYIF